ncbi:uncharacterized protein LOC113239687 [Hyposmocoma kahamanoa]|uniref:uncharacterized protein LOC113239687 n=1 Tax=Hyposmocoma kahamanoa TaxID=1477025 RepID=UPI000E6D61AC|nr:uncharacterized protein LOC113239687 [Hyposmocoma kahamanoa]
MSIRLRLDKCCLCFPLRTGVLIIGYVSMLIALSLFTFCCVSFYKLKQYVKDHENNPEPDFATVDDLHSTANGYYILFSFGILVSQFCFAINVMLVVGIHRFNVRLVRYYTPTSSILVILTLALMVHSYFFLTFSRIWPLLLWSGIVGYFIIVVRRLYLNMRNEEIGLNNQRNTTDIELETLRQ